MASLTDLLFQFIARVRYQLTPSVIADGNQTEMQCDARGFTRVTTAQVASEYSSEALADSDVIFVGPCRLIEVFVYNDNASGRTLQLFDGTSVPANGTVPKGMPLYVPSKATASFTPSAEVRFDDGLCWAASSTVATKTLAGNDLYVVAYYLG